MASASAPSNGPSAVPGNQTIPVPDEVCPCTVKYEKVKVLLFCWSKASEDDYNAHLELIEQRDVMTPTEKSDFGEEKSDFGKYKERTGLLLEETKKVEDFFKTKLKYEVERCVIPSVVNQPAGALGTAQKKPPVPPSDPLPTEEIPVIPAEKNDDDAQATVSKAVKRTLDEIHRQKLSEIHGQKGTLLIVYYAGHALPDNGLTEKEERLEQQSVWAPFECMPASENKLYHDVQKVKWHEIQETLMGAKGTSDLLLILDCCYAGQAARFVKPSGSVTKQAELLAASSMGQKALGAGPGSFTIKMLAEMEKMLHEKSHSINIKLLHGRMSKMVPTTTDQKLNSEDSALKGDSRTTFQNTSQPTPVKSSYTKLEHEHTSNIDLLCQPYHVDMVAVSVSSGITLRALENKD